MPKFTPGPWRVSKCRMGDNFLIEHGDEEEKNSLIAEVYYSSLPAKVNANLIAAAPDLLEACKAAIGYLRFWPVPISETKTTERKAWERAINLIEQALRKAEGKL